MFVRFFLFLAFISSLLSFSSFCFLSSYFFSVSESCLTSGSDLRFCQDKHRQLVYHRFLRPRNSAETLEETRVKILRSVEEGKERKFSLMDLTTEINIDAHITFFGKIFQTLNFFGFLPFFWGGGTQFICTDSTQNFTNHSPW